MFHRLAEIPMIEYFGYRSFYIDKEEIILEYMHIIYFNCRPFSGRLLFCQNADNSGSQSFFSRSGSLCIKGNGT